MDDFRQTNPPPLFLGLGLITRLVAGHGAVDRFLDGHDGQLARPDQYPPYPPPTEKDVEGREGPCHRRSSPAGYLYVDDAILSRRPGAGHADF